MTLLKLSCAVVHSGINHHEELVIFDLTPGKWMTANHWADLLGDKGYLLQLLSDALCELHHIYLT